MEKSMSSKDKITGKMFFRLFIPAIISSLGWAFSDIADAVAVGISLGTTGLAAISLALPVYMVNCTFAHALGTGGSVRFSKLLGQGRKEEAVNNFNVILQGGLLLSVITAIVGSIWLTPLLALLGTTKTDGALFSATYDYLRILILTTPLFYLANLLNDYLRNDEHQKLAVIGSAAGNLTDIALNIILVIFLHKGTAGAATSTAIGQVIAILFYLPGILKLSHTIRIKKKLFQLKEMLSCLASGMSSSVSYLFQLAFLLIVNHVLIRMSGETGVAVFDMIQNTSYLILYLYEGTVRAMQPLVSTYHGEYNQAGKKSVLRLGMLWGNIAGYAVIIFIFLFPELLCYLFGLSGGKAGELGKEALRIYCLSAGAAGISILFGGYYQSCEREKESFFIALFRGCLILLPCTLIFSGAPISLFWWLFPVTEGVSLICYGLKRLFIKSREKDFNQERVFTDTIKMKEGEIIELVKEIEVFCQTWDADIKQQYFLTMAVEEVCMAILQKGLTPIREGQIQLTMIALPEGIFELHIRDNAITFNPLSLDTNKVDSGYFDMEALGMKIVKEKAREVFYRSYQGFNSMILKF